MLHRGPDTPPADSTAVYYKLVSEMAPIVEIRIYPAKDKRVVLMHQGDHDQPSLSGRHSTLYCRKSIFQKATSQVVVFITGLWVQSTTIPFAMDSLLVLFFFCCLESAISAC